jgi:ADP-sugar diphosphatase
MLTFTLLGTDVSVELVNDLSEKELLEFPAFKVIFSLLCFSASSTVYTNYQIELDQKAVRKSLPSNSNPSHEFHKSPYVLRAIHIQVIDRFGEHLCFVKLAVTITNSEGESLPGVVFLRGASVGMMVLLQLDDLP